jgi:hypothetical protein
VFDADFFFGRGFIETVQEFGRDHGDANLRLEIVTLGGERLDTLQFEAVGSGLRVSTRDDRLIFLPYPHIAYIDVSAMRDHRIAGFQLSPGSEVATSDGSVASRGTSA